jgi:hypothetical protein
MIQLEFPQNRFLVTDSDVPWTVMPHEDEILIKVHGVKFGITATNSQSVHDEHSDAIFQVPLPTTGNALPRQQRKPDNHPGSDPLIFVG